MRRAERVDTVLIFIVWLWSMIGILLVWRERSVSCETMLDGSKALCSVICSVMTESQQWIWKEKIKYSEGRCQILNIYTKATTKNFLDIMQPLKTNKQQALWHRDLSKQRRMRLSQACTKQPQLREDQHRREGSRHPKPNYPSSKLLGTLNTGNINTARM